MNFERDNYKVSISGSKNQYIFLYVDKYDHHQIVIKKVKNNEWKCIDNGVYFHSIGGDRFPNLDELFFDAGKELSRFGDTYFISISSHI
jgi:uncharacterized protein YlbG (UPF0298 family)